MEVTEVYGIPVEPRPQKILYKISYKDYNLHVLWLNRKNAE